MGKLNEKRIDSLIVIISAAGIGGFATFIPTPSGEIPKQVALSAADIAMCLEIFHIYFREKITEIGLFTLLSGAGLIAASAGGTGYVIAKAASGILHEFGNLIGSGGWALSGAVAASGTAMLGLSWMVFCDKRYRQLYPITEKASFADAKQLAQTINKLSATVESWVRKQIRKAKLEGMIVSIALPSVVRLP
jgi:hypothetical protein